MSLYSDLKELVLHLRWCTDCHDQSSEHRPARCPTMRRLWLATIGNPDASYPFPFDPPHPEAQPADIDVAIKAGLTELTLTERTRQ